MKWIRRIASGMAILLCTVSAEAKGLSLPSIFSEHMVLQAEARVPVWGWANPGDTVTVEFAGQKKSAVAGESGKWQVKLDPLKASAEPRSLQVSSFEFQISLNDVVVGEVWLASGQSNMGVNVGRSDGADEGAKLVEDLDVRFFGIPLNLSLEPQDVLPAGKWTVITPQNSSRCPAVGYYFACKVARTLNSPVAVIQSAWGGSKIQNWMPYDVLQSSSKLRGYVSDFEQRFSVLPDAQKTPEGLVALGNVYRDFNRTWVEYQKDKKGPEPVPPTTPRPRHAVALNYNAMIHPLVPYAIKGALWYQGESNSNDEDALLYAEMLSSMIRSWRSSWNSSFPFIFAQLPEYAAAGKEDAWVCLRDQQRRVLDQTEHTAMVVTLGHGDMKNIHPRDKRPVGELMANAACSKAYQRNTPWCGPLIQSAVQKGDELVLTFETFGRQLRSSSPELTGFEVSEDGNAFHPVSAKIKNGQVVIPIDESVQCVRYGWDVNPKLTLYDDAGLPASPFKKRCDKSKIGQNH